MPLKIGGNTNSSFLALIPKETNPTTFSRFQPISLCNSSYKILTKIIATRLKIVLSKLISPNQGGFMQDRQFEDSIVLVQEAIHTSYRTKSKGMVIKLDMANAFDRVWHSFLFEIMEPFEFSKNFIRWISACINGPLIAPLVNDGPSAFFQASRGLWKGCPLSPLLFIIVAKTLSTKLEQKHVLGNLLGLQIAWGTKNINHSQFADNTLFMGGASTTIASRFKSILDSFLNASSGQVNNRKC